MAYTIPTSADTTEQAILAVASAVKGEQVTGGDGSVNTALDILADALAGEDVEVPMTQQGAILALAQYVGGGGGGVDVGALHVVINGDPTTQAGDELGSAAIIKLSIGDSVISHSFTEGNPYIDTIDDAAEGVTVDVYYALYNDEETAPSAVFKPCTIDTETFTYVTISDPLEVENTTYALTEGVPSSMWVTRFVMPELPEGSALFVTHAAE